MLNNENRQLSPAEHTFDRVDHKALLNPLLKSQAHVTSMALNISCRHYHLFAFPENAYMMANLNS